jgi:hypothetical protein
MPDSSGAESLFVCLYLDQHVNVQLAVDLRARGYDVLTTQDAGNEEASDDVQLAFATDQRRAILTFNIRDFAPLHEQWQNEGRNHGGIVVSRQMGHRTYGLLLE